MLTDPIIGISVIVLPFVALVIWAIRRGVREDRNRHLWLNRLAQALNGSKAPKAFDAQFELQGTTYTAGIGHGGESDSDMAYVSQTIEPLPDAIVFIFERGINRWLSKNLETGDV